MKKILFPTDFSKTSLNAFVYALHLAKQIDAEIITLYVYEFPIGLPVDNFDFLLENYNVGEWGVFENFKGEVPKLRAIAEKENLENVPLSHLLERGNAVDEIVKSALKENADMIIMGTKGATGLKEIFLGTVAEKVMKHSKTFVIAVPENYSYEPIQTILFLTEYKKLEMDLLQKVSDFAAIFQAQIRVLEVGSNLGNGINILVSRWEEQFKSKDIAFAVIDSANTEKTVLEFIEDQQINMASMSLHHKNLFQRLFLFSLSKKMAFHSSVPLLGIPA